MSNRKPVAFFVNNHGYISHFLPIIERMPEIQPIIITTVKETAIYAKQLLGIDAVCVQRDEHLWHEVRRRQMLNVISCYQKLTGDWRALNTIQIFHGVSFKGPDLANWKPERWQHLMVQGEHFWEPYTTRYPEYAHRMQRTSFTRAYCYENAPEWNRKGPVLYMPSHRDAGLLALRENIRLMITSGLDVMVKLHPINHLHEAFMQGVHQLFRHTERAQLITHDDPRYFRYDELMKESSCLVSDFSSVVCEYTLLDRPIVILRGGPDRNMRHNARDNRHLEPSLFHVGEDRRVDRTIHDAIIDFKPGQYPNLYIKDGKDIVQAIREALR